MLTTKRVEMCVYVIVNFIYIYLARQWSPDMQWNRILKCFSEGIFGWDWHLNKQIVLHNVGGPSPIKSLKEKAEPSQAKGNSPGNYLWTSSTTSVLLVHQLTDFGIKLQVLPESHIYQILNSWGHHNHRS